MKILFCNDELEPRSVDSCFEAEAASASKNGLEFGLLDFDAVRKGNGERAVRFISKHNALITAVYRGWKLTPAEYETLYFALQTKNVRLVNSPSEYQHCHWLPESYSVIQDHTPKTVWVKATDKLPDIQSVMKALKPFGSHSAILKDYVKSRKHEWFDACFIPDASDEPTVTRVMRRFLELQGSDLQGGLVFREFVEFEPLGTHPKSGMPLTLEFRLFVLNGKVISESDYWDINSGSERPPLAQFEKVLKNVRSRFFSCDVAKSVDGRWLIVELGDGQVSGLPERCDVDDFYSHLIN